MVATAKAKFLSNMSLITTLALTDDAPRSSDRDAWALLLGETRLSEGDTLSACGVEENTLLSLVVAAATGAAAVNPANAAGTVTFTDKDTNELRKEQATASDADGARPRDGRRRDRTGGR